jgi:NADH dehydrogenase/NADH:ubiquinone reductase (non-electrogenic)
VSGRSFPRFRGLVASLLWRGTYTSKQLSYQNMILVPMFWFKSVVFGRD